MVKFLPFLGYHHILMILIAIAIILLCKAPTHIPNCRGSTRLTLLAHSTPTGRMLKYIASDPRHLPHIHVLQVVHTNIRPVTSGPRRDSRHCQHCRPRRAGGARGLLWHLRQPERRRVPVLQ